MGSVVEVSSSGMVVEGIKMARKMVHFSIVDINVPKWALLEDCVNSRSFLARVTLEIDSSAPLIRFYSLSFQNILLYFD